MKLTANETKTVMTLDKLPVGKEADILQVGGEGALRLRLLDMGIIPKTKVTVRKVAPMGDPIEIHIRDYELTLRLEDAIKINVMENEVNAK
jgi:Fe2+ transport system protein FeoA